jgi:hypothetical protein
MHDPGISEYDRLRAEYEGEMFEVTTALTPSEIRHIIARRREMEARIGTNGSIKLTMKIAQSVHDLMSALSEFQDQQVPEEEDQDDEVEVLDGEE